MAFPPHAAVSQVTVHAHGRWNREAEAAFLSAATRLGQAYRCPIHLAPAPRECRSPLALSEWARRDFDPLVWDTRLQALEDRTPAVLELCADQPPATLSALERTLLRYQRLLPLPANCQEDPQLAAILRLHRSLHDLSRPLVRADYDHALDTWRWLLRLAPKADLALQSAALFHDIERLESEADARTEHLAEDYLAFKLRHARRGSELLKRLFTSINAKPTVIDQVCYLVSEHEQPGSDPRLRLLNDADGLSFFSLNSYGYLRYFGPERAQKKVGYTLRRLSPGARNVALCLHHHPLVQELLDQLDGAELTT